MDLNKKDIPSPEPAAKPLETLGDLQAGRVCQVVAVQSGPMQRRLLELGFVPGSEIRIVRFAPAGDPMEVALHGFHIAIRRSDAETISIQRRS